MKFIKSFILSSLLLAVVFIAGCNEQPTTSNEPIGTNNQLPKFSLPAGAALTTAYLHIYVNEGNNELVNIFGISSTWDEMTVTWNTRPSLYTPVEATFTPTTTGWITVDITGLVGKWLDGTYTNYGLLLDQVDPDITYATYSSKDGANKPYIEVNYTGGSANVIDTADAYVWELNPDTNYNLDILYTGYVYDYEKQSLLKFDIEYIPEVECETSYAFDDDTYNGVVGTCFIDLGFGNWGWSIYLPATGTYTFPVYAGAGQCDITKGTYVGDVTAIYSGGTVNFDYDFEPGFSTEETHFYAGITPTPIVRGKATVAPGKYRIGTGLSGGIYIIAHAVVCSSDWD